MGQRILGLALALLGLLSGWDSWRITRDARESGNFDAVGPDRYLLLVGCLMILTGLAMAIWPPPAAPMQRSGRLWPPSKPALATGGLVGAVILMPLAGFTLACLAFFLALYATLNRWTWQGVAASALVTTGIFWIVFVWVADLSLPKGPFGF